MMLNGKTIWGLALIVFAANSHAASFFEVSAGPSRLALDITRLFDPNFSDDSTAMNFALGAYRHSSNHSAWGAVIEYTQPTGRDKSLPGDGSIVGFRPINYLRSIGTRASVELYAGAAQYQWRRTANGYYFGTSLRYEFDDINLSVGVDAKFYQDLAHDSTGTSAGISESSDNIVQGFNTGIKLFYRFK